MKAAIVLTAPVAAFLLAGCSGGTVPGIGVPTFADRQTAALNLYNTALAEPLTGTTPGGMPVAGSATYTGYAAFETTGLTADDTFVADATLNATFTGAGGTVSGTITNFEGSVVGPTGGTFNVTGGTITGDTYAATVGGTFNDAGTNRAFTGSTGGAFFGDDAPYIAGALGGTFAGGGQITVDPITTLPNGVIVGEQ